ncbi:hypothetical protein MAR_013644 [Mya arenaria]|uniref:Uncharacterized protein n=1 Tax=Mya arenaria TaxID=6604 RepID=A0ABY7G0G0_MYAAR|nr:hypothetical protein MAR_013644 [Mya arenaria]
MKCLLAVTLVILAVACVNGVNIQCLSPPKEHTICREGLKTLKWTYVLRDKKCAPKWGCYVSDAKNVFGTEAGCRLGCEL